MAEKAGQFRVRKRNAKRSGRGIAGVFVGLVVTYGLPDVASAQNYNSAGELNRWLAQLQTTGSTVQVGAVESSVDGSYARARNLVIEAPALTGQAAHFKVTLGVLTLTGASETASEYRADRAHVDNLEVAFGESRLNANAVDITNAALPRSLQAGGDPQHPTASLVHFARAVFAAHATNVAFTGVSLLLPGADPPSTLAQLSVDNIDAGTIDALRLHDLHVQHREPESETRIAEFSLQKASPAALLAILDPQSYKATSLDRPWKPFIEHATLKSLDVSVAGGHTTLQQVDLGPLEARRFSFDPTPVLDLAAAAPEKLKEQPALTAQFSAEVADSLRIDKATFRAVVTDDGADPPKRRTQVDSIEVADLAPRAAKSVRVSGLQVLAEGAGVRIGTLSAADVQLAPGAPLGNGAPATTIPMLSSLTLDQIVLVRSGVNASLGTVKVATEDYVGRVPTHLEVSISGAAIPVVDLPENALKANLAALKIDPLKFDASVSATWQAASEQLDLSSAQISVADVGTLSATGSLAGVPRSVFEHPETISALALTAGVKQARLNYQDSGLTGRVLAKFAEVNKISADKVRNALTSNMPTIFGAISDAASRNRLIFAAISFLNDPKMVSVFTTLDTPAPLAKLIEAWRVSPQTLPGLLKLEAVANHPS